MAISITINRQASQNRCSTVFMVMIVSTARYIGASNTARHASACAARFPPSRAAITPVRITRSVPEIVAMSRNPRSEGPSHSPIRA